MKHEPGTRTHSADDPPAMVIHHPEEDETILARWLRRAMAKGASFWILAGGTLGLGGDADDPAQPESDRHQPGLAGAASGAGVQ